MSELNFHTKLIRLAKATITMMYCVQIQKDCSESFETRQGLRQGDVRRANLQATGTIYNKERQLLTYADDIDIVGRSQSALRDAYLAKLGLVTNTLKS
jgi:hypothetical protein